ncbi:hypothetical protein MO973_09555 [Paenibacillus sp. TRM 82003]|uniref:hypothetical protein n=1 Tax=Kineococcus sp. TRM81007 TaxID=2925831 RepID=UPI001F576AC8|nr:hypothetical protein [Kineococcus sp. TRM81007]MCI2238094.1 hypothetical protein [Kineococcus sp. TRM81007]MCI3920478.1 hypothetical protein [Paenibacillus sp. TRM 82003]
MTDAPTLSRAELGQLRRNLVIEQKRLFRELVEDFSDVNPFDVAANIQGPHVSASFMAMRLVSSGVRRLAAPSEPGRAKQAATVLEGLAFVSDAIRRVDLHLVGESATADALHKFIGPTTVVPRSINDLFDSIGVRLGYGAHFFTHPNQLASEITASEYLIEDCLGVTSVVAIRIIEAVAAAVLYGPSTEDKTNAQDSFKVNLQQVHQMTTYALRMAHGGDYALHMGQIENLLYALSEPILKEPIDLTLEYLTDPYHLTQQVLLPMRHDQASGEWYCFGPYMLPYALECLIAATIKDAAKSDSRGPLILEERASSLEAAVSAYLKDGLGRQSKIWAGISYHDLSSGLRLGELDVIAHVDDFLLVAECKSGVFSMTDQKSVSNSLDELARKPSSQLQRFAEAWKSHGSHGIEFRDKENNPLSRQERRSLAAALNAPLTVQAVVTLDDLGVMSSFPSMLGRLRGRPMRSDAATPISFGLTDLLTVCQVLRGPYLQNYFLQRQYWARTGSIFWEDEAGLLSIYLSSRLGQSTATLETAQNFGLEWRKSDPKKPVESKFQSIYVWREKRSQGIEEPPPALRMPQRLRALINDINASQRKHWTTAMAILLSRDADWEGRLSATLDELDAEVTKNSGHTLRLLWVGASLLYLDFSDSRLAAARTTDKKLDAALEISKRQCIVAISQPGGRGSVTIRVHGRPDVAFAGVDVVSLKIPELTPEMQYALSELLVNGRVNAKDG